MITYEGICEKLGFRLEDYSPKYSGHEDDSIPNPFSVLTSEELDFVINYAKNMDKQKKD